MNALKKIIIGIAVPKKEREEAKKVKEERQSVYQLSEELIRQVGQKNECK